MQCIAGAASAAPTRRAPQERDRRSEAAKRSRQSTITFSYNTHYPPELLRRPRILLKHRVDSSTSHNAHRAVCFILNRTSSNAASESSTAE